MDRQIVWALKSTFIFLLVNFSAAYAQKELITRMTVSHNKLSCAIHPSLKEAYLTDDFFVEYDEDINLEEMDYEVLSLPVVLNLFSLAWFSGEDYYVDSMDYDVYESLEKLKKMFKTFYPECPWSGSIKPRKLVSLSQKFMKMRLESNSRALLFSGGLDSTSSFFEHRNEDLLLITAWGQFDLPLSNKEGWQGRKESIIKFASKYGKKNAFLRSNYSEIFNWSVVNHMYRTIDNWRMGTIEGLSWAGLILPILISKKCPFMYLPSGNCWNYTYFDCIMIPHVEENIVFAGFRLITDQFEMTRFDKAKFIVDTCNKHNLERPFIKVCYLPNENCGACRKCCMTMISLLALGENLSEHGYTCCSEQVAIQNTLKFMDSQLSFFSAWNFKEMQIKIGKLVQNYPSRKALLEPFLNYDTSNLFVIDRRYCIKFNWSDIQHFAPLVKVPLNLSPEILNIVV